MMVADKGFDILPEKLLATLDGATATALAIGDITLPRFLDRIGRVANRLHRLEEGVFSLLDLLIDFERASLCLGHGHGREASHGFLVTLTIGHTLEEPCLAARWSDAEGQSLYGRVPVFRMLFDSDSDKVLMFPIDSHGQPFKLPETARFGAISG
nr:hypothetical protein [Qipengyuania gelatinilytica]